MSAKTIRADCADSPHGGPDFPCDACIDAALRAAESEAEARQKKRIEEICDQAAAANARYERGLVEAEARGYERGLEAAAKTRCVDCRDGFPLNGAGHQLPHGVWHECTAWGIRALASQPVPAEPLSKSRMKREAVMKDEALPVPAAQEEKT